MIKNLLLCTLCFLAGIGFGVAQLGNGNSSDVDMAATADDVYYSDRKKYDNFIGKYFKEKYGDVEGFYEYDRRTISNVKNFNQKELNKHYNEVKQLGGKGCTGTCAIVATLGLLNCYGTARGEFSINESDKDAFVRIFDACLKEGYTSLNEGTSKSDEEDCVDVAFSIYGSSRTGNTNWWYLHDNIYDAVNYNAPIILSLTDHAVVVVGVTKYKIIIKNPIYEMIPLKNSPFFRDFIPKTIEYDEEFVIVNDGWGSKEYSGYVPFSKITSYSDNMQVIWAEL